MITLQQFYLNTAARASTTGERYGQAIFNYLHEVRPGLAEEIRGTDKDPFYVDESTDPRWERFVEYIESVWYQ